MYNNNMGLDMYYLAFQNDRSWLKIIVYGVYCLETVQAALVASQGLLLYNFQRQRYMFSSMSMPMSMPSQQDDGWNQTVVTYYTAVVVLRAIGMFLESMLGNFANSTEVAFVVQSFYAYRLHILTHRSWIIMILINVVRSPFGLLSL